MKISFIKCEKEAKFKIPELFGINIEEIEKPEQVDEKIEELKEQKFTTIIIQNELASFSEKIIREYKYDKSLNIIIIPSKYK